MRYFLFLFFLPFCLFAQSIEYTYDNAGRLIQAKYGSKIIHYTYDNRGNQIKKEIIVGSEHEVSTPDTPAGPSHGKPGDILSYQTGNSECSQGHEVEYSMDWGDGTNSSWGTAQSTHAYQNSAEYQIRARARCKQDNSVLSPWSPNKKVVISEQDNQPPLAPELLSPDTDATDVPWQEVEFVWKKTTDPENDPISYRLVYSTEPMLGKVQEKETHAYFWSGKWGALGICFILPFLLAIDKKKVYTILYLVLFIFAIACQNSGKDNVENNQISQIVRNLNPATRYFWRVEVQDNLGNQSASEVRTFVTRN